MAHQASQEEHRGQERFPNITLQRHVSGFHATSTPSANPPFADTARQKNDRDGALSRGVL
ncbi:hypothetical protein D187_006979 [Cystobacter fuscus DSM 2262]|uniref:Uncharacterized protein n=1 Tax=Cystobacter fuscus (strain ATCC 25194 / DSM 2262 / NBRC 100088 / M29) TaxID=1242864 RepID=S9NYD5_CYSF2|nr:hypothetical protein D187_006979 [Cystobacter fuscus DSM 2262]